MKDHKLIQNVAGRYVRRAADTSAPTGDAEEAPGIAPNTDTVNGQAVSTLPPGRLIDLILFVVAYDAYLTFLEAKGVDKDALSAKSLSLLRRYYPELLIGLIGQIYPLDDRNDAGHIRTALHRAKRTGSIQITARYQADMFKVVLPWLKIKQTLFMEIFSGRASQIARQVASIVQEESPAALLNKAATIPSASGLSAIRRWVTMAAASAGVPITATEGVVADSGTATIIGEEIQQTDAQIAAAAPNTPEAAKLQEKRTSLVKNLATVAENSDDKSTVLAAGAIAAAPKKHGHATDTGAKAKLSPEQEAAMIMRGKALMAAGAGSGKTRVLAAQVAYHTVERGISPDSVIATSFTRKSAAELIRRIKEVGGDIPSTAKGFGTTHSISMRMLYRVPAFRRPRYIDGEKEGWKQTTLLRLAMEQVQMTVTPIPPAPPPAGIWQSIAEEAKALPTAPPPVAPEADVVVPTQGSYQAAVTQTLDNIRRGKPWMTKNIGFLADMLTRTPESLTPKQKNYLNGLMAENNVVFKVAAEESPTPRKVRKGMESYQFYRRPANQWFNQGLKFESKVKSIGSGASKPKEKNILPLGEFKTAISIFKGKGISPSEAWAGVGPYGPESPKAAVYGAYEWLKGGHGEPDFINTGDMDDILIDTVRALVENPAFLRDMQNQFKIILIDEAQDINRTQHLLFGLIAGYIDPKTLKPWLDKHMKADTYSLIGDDKQAIYGFRGAEADGFIEKSDLYETDGQKGDFETRLLEMNYRSGEAIVKGANNLIAFNKKQVPMVCRANVDKNGQGELVTRPVESVAKAAESVASEIEDIMKGDAAGANHYKDFGVGVRTNAEAYHYGLELLKKGIPFKTKKSFFNDPSTKSLIGWLTIAEQGLTGSVDLVNQSVWEASRSPASMLGEQFFEGKVKPNAKNTSWVEWFMDEEWKVVVSPGQNWYAAADQFSENLRFVTKLKGDPKEVFQNLLTLKGIDGETIKENLVSRVLEDADSVLELSAEVGTEDGKVSMDQVEEKAMAPLEPLIGLLTHKAELAEAMDFIRVLRKVNAKKASDDSEKTLDRDAVTIGTMHSWKGLEVPNMYIPLIGGKFPRTGKGQEQAEDGPDLWAERRLAYVAITRGERRSVLLDIPSNEGLHSQFVTEVCAPLEGQSEGSTTIPKGKEASQEWTDDQIEELERERAEKGRSR